MHPEHTAAFLAKMDGSDRANLAFSSPRAKSALNAAAAVYFFARIYYNKDVWICRDEEIRARRNRAASEPGRVRARWEQAVRASVPSAALNGVSACGCARYSARGLRAPGERAHCANLGGTAREPRPNVGRGFFVRKSRGAFEDFQRTRGRQGGYTP